MENNRNIVYLIALFFLWPFMAFLVALRSFGRLSSRIVIYLFLILYGFTFIVSSDLYPVLYN